MAGVYVLLAKPEFTGNPTAIPPDMALEEWIDQNFALLGPISLEAAESFTESLGAANPDRYWGILPINDGRVHVGN